MKKLVFILFMSLALFGCGGTNTDSASMPDYQISTVEYSYKERYQTLDEVIDHSDCIVKATLVSSEDFNGYINEYYFTVDEDYIGNGSSEVYMYDAYNPEYIEGHTYFLFLSKNDVALYPHPVYTTVAKGFILDLEDVVAQTEIMGTSVTIELNEVEEEIQQNIAGTSIYAVESDFIETEIMDGTDISNISEMADIIGKIRVSNEEKGNKYASAYEIEVVGMLKGNEDAIATHMFLPSDLEEDRDYYVFLKESSENAGEYLLFARDIPLVEVTEEVTATLSLD